MEEAISIRLILNDGSSGPDRVEANLADHAWPAVSATILVALRHRRGQE